MSNEVSSLTVLLQQHIDTQHGGNHAECARALGISPQHLSALMTGKIRTPRVELRRRLSQALGVGQVRLLALTGAIDLDDPELPPDPPPSLARLVALLQDPRLESAHLDYLGSLVLGMLDEIDRSSGAAAAPPSGGGASCPSPAAMGVQADG